MKNTFNICLRNPTSLNTNSEVQSFQYSDKYIYNQQYQTKYNFDSIFLIDDVNREMSQFQTNTNENNIYIIYGPPHSGKSTLLRGKHKLTSIKCSEDNSTNSINVNGEMMNIVKDSYNKLLNKMNTIEDIIVITFGAFAIDLSNNKDNDSSYNAKISSLIDKENDKKKKNYFDRILNKNNNTYIIKYISSFSNLNFEMESVIKRKVEEYDNNESYSILYHYSIEVKGKELTTNKYIYLNFFEVNSCITEELQPFLLYANSLSKNKDDIISEITNINISNEQSIRFINILCLEDLNISSQGNLLCLKIVRFLELKFKRNELYDNSNELWEKYCELTNELRSQEKEKEEILKNINEMTEEAIQLYSMLTAMKSYQRNTLQQNKESFMQIKTQYENLASRADSLYQKTK